MDKSRCPKCFSTLLSVNSDGDCECVCGYVIYNNPKQVEIVKESNTKKVVHPLLVSKDGKKVLKHVGRKRTGQQQRCSKCKKVIWVAKNKRPDRKVPHLCRQCWLELRINPRVYWEKQVSKVFSEV